MAKPGGPYIYQDSYSRWKNLDTKSKQDPFKGFCDQRGFTLNKSESSFINQSQPILSLRTYIVCEFYYNFAKWDNNIWMLFCKKYVASNGMPAVKTFQLRTFTNSSPLLVSLPSSGRRVDQLATRASEETVWKQGNHHHNRAHGIKSDIHVIFPILGDILLWYWLPYSYYFKVVNI